MADESPQASPPASPDTPRNPFSRDAFRKKWPIWSMIALSLLFIGVAVATAYRLGFWSFPHTHELTALPEGEAHSLFVWIAHTLGYASLFFIIGIFLVQMAINKKAEAGAMQVDNNEEKRLQKTRRERRADLMHELGMAFLVGSVVVVTFELSLRVHEQDQLERQQKSIQTNIFKHLLGYRIDPAVLEEIHEGVFASKLIREDMSVTYQFCDIGEEKGYLRLRTEISYKLINMSNDIQNYHLTHYFHSLCPTAKREDRDRFTDLVVSFPRQDVPLKVRSDKSPKSHYYTIINVDDHMTNCCVFKDEEEDMEHGIKQQPPKVEGHGVKKRDLVAGLVSREGENVKLTQDSTGFVHGIHVPEPIQIPPGKPLYVKYSYVQKKRYNDMVTIITTHPVKNFSVKAFLCDPRLAHLRLEADSAHRLDPVSEAIPVKNAMYYEWSLPGAVLPGQGFELYWYAPEEHSSTSVGPNPTFVTPAAK